MSAHESKSEVSNPVLWTAALFVFTIATACWFAFWISKGETHGRGNPHPVKAEGVVRGVPDHAALIKDLSPEVLAHGKDIYLANCASCHGPKGIPVVANARNFTADAFKNDKHGAKAHPWTMFDTLTNGFNSGAMAPQTHIAIEDRYAVIHYIRETLVKEQNKSQYVSVEEALKSDFPAPVAASGDVGLEGPHPHSIPVSIPVYAVLEQESTTTLQKNKISAEWLARVDESSVDVSLRNALVSVKDFAGTELGFSIVKYVNEGNEAQLVALLLKPEVAAIDPVFGTLTKNDFHHLYTALATGRSK